MFLLCKHLTQIIAVIISWIQKDNEIHTVIHATIKSYYIFLLWHYEQNKFWNLFLSKTKQDKTAPFIAAVKERRQHGEDWGLHCQDGRCTRSSWPSPCLWEGLMEICLGFPSGFSTWECPLDTSLAEASRENKQKTPRNLSRTLGA